MTTQYINIDPNKSLDLALRGTYRAYVFCAAVLNKKNGVIIKNLHINDDFRVFSYDNENEMINDAKNEFVNFVIHSALNSMIEMFDKSLEDLYFALSISNKRIANKDYYLYQIDKDKFSKKNYPDKIKIIDKILNHKLSEQKTYWQSLKDIRNCISHHMGLVDKESIKISIPKLTTYIKGNESGKIIYMNPGEIFDTQELHEEEKTLMVKFDKIEKTFRHAEYIIFTKDEVNYLIWGMYTSINEFKKIIYDHFNSHP